MMDRLDMTEYMNINPYSAITMCAINTYQRLINAHVLCHILGLAFTKAWRKFTLYVDSSMTLSSFVRKKSTFGMLEDRISKRKSPAVSSEEWLSSGQMKHNTTTSDSTVIDQLKLLMVLLKRVQRNAGNFNLEILEFFEVIIHSLIKRGSEITVSRYIKVIYRQHKSEKISLSDLLKETDSAFSLLKCFTSYRKIKKNPELSKYKIEDYTICTNVDFGFAQTSEICLTPAGEFDRILNSHQALEQSKQYKLAVDGQHELYRILKKSSDAYALAQSLAEHVSNEKYMDLSTEIFKFYHVALATEVIDVKNKRFTENFTNGENLSQGAKKFRVEFLKHMKSLDKDITEEFLRTKIKTQALNLPPHFGTKFEPEAQPTLTNITEFVEAFVRLMRKPKYDYLITIDREIHKQTAHGGSDEEVIRVNIDKLAGHVLIVEDEQIKFRSQFTDGTCKLQGDIKKFREMLRQLLNNDFEKLDKYRFEIINSPIWDSLYSRGSKLPDDYVESEEIRDFFDKLVFAVNQPSDDELKEIIKDEMSKHSPLYLLGDVLSDTYLRKTLQCFYREVNKTKEGGTRFSIQNGSDFCESIKMQIMKQMCLQLSSGYVEELEEYGIEFENTIKKLKDFVDDGDNRIFNVISSIGETLLTAIRVHSTITGTEKERRNYVISMRLHELLASPKMGKVTSLCKSTYDCILLVIDCGSSDGRNLPGFPTFCQQLNSFMKKENNSTKLVLITNRNQNFRPITSKLRSVFNYKETFDEVNFNNLTEGSRNRLLNKLTIDFQGRQNTLVNFRKLLGNRSYDDILSKKKTDFGNAVDASTLCKLIRGTTIKMGYNLKGYPEAGDFYIPRKFDEVCLRTDILNCQLTSEIFAISGLDLTELPRELMIHREKIRSFHNVDRQTRHVNKFIILDTERDIEQFKELCAEYSSDYNVHWLKSESKKFIWKKSHGDITNLLEYRDVGESTTKYLTEDDLAGHNGGHKVVIISNDPGMGKTTLFKSLARKMIANESGLWVIDINLSQKVLQDEQRHRNFDESDVDAAINFFVEKLADLETELEKNVLKTMMKDHGRVALLFDEFNELCPEYRKIVINLLRTFKKHGIKKLIISTRPGVTKILEERLGIFSYTMQPFSEKNQIAFLTEWWKLLDLVEQRILERKQTYAKAVIGKIGKSIIDRGNKFTGNPLYTRMIAEIFQQGYQNIEGEKEDFETCDEFCRSEHEEPRLMESIDIIDLHKHFFDLKFYIYAQGNVKMGPENSDTEKLLVQYPKEEFNETFEVLALQRVLEDEDLRTLITNLIGIGSANNDKIKKKIEGMKGVDFINKMRDGELNFTYPSYAEYFLANFLISKLMMKPVSDIAHNRDIVKFILRILFAPSYRTTRTFVNALLLKYNDFPSDQQWKDKAFTNQFRESALVKYHNIREGNILHVTVNERNAGILKYILCQFSELDKTWKALITCKKISSVDHPHTPVTLAAYLGHWDEFKLLLEHDKAYVNILNDSYYSTPLHYAASMGKLDVVEYLVDKGADITAQNNDGETPLHCAASNGHLEVVKYLVGKGADINAQKKDGKTPLHCAVSMRKLDVVKYLVDEGADIHARKADAETPLHCAASNSHLNVVEFLVGKGADTNAQKKDGKTPLHCAALNCNMDMVGRLLEKGANPNAIDTHKKTPLHYAAALGDFKMVQRLVQKGANLNGIYVDKKTPLHYAASNGDLNMVQWLVEQGAYLNAKETEGKTPLHYAISRCDLQVVQWLIDIGADVDAIDTYEKIPLHYAALSGQLEMVKSLVKYVTDLNAVDTHGETPLDCAASTGNLDVVKYLVEKGADINAQKKDGKTPLHYAASNGQLDVVKYLVDKGADNNAQKDNGETPLHCAASTGNLDLIKYLVGKGADINAQKKDGETPLHYAASMSKLYVVKYLVNERADINAQKEDGETPLHYAAFMGKLDVVQYLVEKGAIVDAKGTENKTPLHCAASTGNSDVVKYLVENGADVEAKGTDDKTPLYCAASMGHLDVVKFLVKKGHHIAEGTQDKELYVVSSHKLNVVKWLVEERRLDIRTEFYSGKSLLEVAVDARSWDVVQWLVEENAATYQSDDDSTLLHVAAANKEWEVVDRLAQLRPLDVKAENKAGKTVIGYAIESGNLDAIKWLVDRKYIDLNADKFKNGETILNYAITYGDLKVVKLLVEKGANVATKGRDGKTVKTVLDAAASARRWIVFEWLLDKTDMWI